MRPIKTAALAAALAVTGSAALAATPAHAATPSCGSVCTDFYNQALGGKYLSDVYRQGQAPGTPLILFQRSNNDPALDWVPSLDGTVNSIRVNDPGLVSANLALNYGTYEAYELEYAPFGAPTGLCAGTDGPAVQNGKVSLQACGVSGATLWVVDGTPGAVTPLINGSDVSFAHPLVLDYSGSPTSVPRPQLYVSALATYSTGTVVDGEMWGWKTGVQP